MSATGVLSLLHLLSRYHAFCKGLGLTKDGALQDAEDEWETVPVRGKGRKHAADASAASSPNNPPHGKLAKADAPDSEDDALPAATPQAVLQQLGAAEAPAPREAGVASLLMWECSCHISSGMAYRSSAVSPSASFA